MSCTIELDEARTLLRKAMETQGPDFIYNSDMDNDGSGCSYIPMTNLLVPASKRVTGCLVGVALDLAGVTFHHQPPYTGVTIERLAQQMASEDVLTLSSGAVNYWMIAQRRQDAGSPWGAAYDEAESLAETLIPFLSGAGN